MIKILAGYVSVNGEVKTDKDAPFSTNPDYEKELVKNGFAEFVEEIINDKTENEDVTENDNKTEQREGNGVEGIGEEKEEKIIPTTKMTFEQLKGIALSKGIDEKMLVDEKGKNITKAKVVELILSVEEEDDTETSTDEGEELDLGNGVEGIV